MESDPGYSAYNAGLINVKVTAAHVRPHHVICGLLRRPGSYDIVVTNIRSSLSNTFIRAWSYPFVDERVIFRGGQMENFGFVPPRWPYGLPLLPVPLPPAM